MSALKAILLAFIFCFTAEACAQGQVSIDVERRIRLTRPNDGNGYIWTVPPELTNEQLRNVLLVEGQAGKYRIQITIFDIDWENQKFTQRNGFVEIEIGTKPGPGPNPPTTSSRRIDCPARKNRSFHRSIPRINSSLKRTAT